MALLSQTVKISQDAGPQNSKNLSKTKISQKSTGSVEIEKFSKLKMFQVATNILTNVKIRYSISMSCKIRRLPV